MSESETTETYEDAEERMFNEARTAPKKEEVACDHCGEVFDVNEPADQLAAMTHECEGEEEEDTEWMSAVDLVVKIAEDGWEHDGEVDARCAADAGWLVNTDETVLVTLRDGRQFLVTVQEVTR